jgi:DNA-binding transcriptional ArsR family regulator
MAGSTAEKSFNALGNPVRRQILRLLLTEPRAVGEIASNLPVSRPAVSRHLRILESARLVAHEKQGNRNIFRLDGEGLRSAQAYLDGFWDGALARFKMVAENSFGREQASRRRK